MPFLKYKNAAGTTPRWRNLEKLADKNGYRAAVFGKSTAEKYTGWFKNNVKQGKGYQSYEDGTFYEGNWNSNQRSGQGYLSFKCPSTKKVLRIYTGQWKDDLPNQEGMKSFLDGSLYRGDFKHGKRHGWGCLYYPDGRIYIGQWYRDLRHGVGRLINHETRNFYEGSFLFDKKSGLGRYYHINTGQLQEGVWFEDQPQATVMVDDEKIRDMAPNPTEFDIPWLTILRDPDQVYLNGVYSIMEKVNSQALEEAGKISHGRRSIC